MIRIKTGSESTRGKILSNVERCVCDPPKHRKYTTDLISHLLSPIGNTLILIFPQRQCSLNLLCLHLFKGINAHFALTACLILFPSTHIHAHAYSLLNPLIHTHPQFHFPYYSTNILTCHCTIIRGFLGVSNVYFIEIKFGFVVYISATQA